MSHLVEVVLTVASVITALGAILGLFVTIHNIYLKREKNDEDIKSIKEEQLILTKGVLACLKGLKEQGCDGPVTTAIEEIETHMNEQAHK